MLNFINVKLVLACLLAGICASLKAQTTPYPTDIQNKIRQVEHSLATWVQIEGTPKWTLDERMQLYHVKGISIAVIHNYQVEWAKGYGWADTTQKRPVSPETLFQAASISKSLNAMGDLRLVQEQKVDLEKDINLYLKRWQFPYDSVSKGKKINLAHLLSHTARLSVHGFEGYQPQTTLPTVTQILDGQKPANSPAVRSVAEPGKKFQYSGGGICLTQLMIEDMTHQPYEQYIWTHVLKPLGMRNSTFAQPPSPTIQSKLATGYRFDNQPIGSPYHIYPEQAPAGLWSTPTDIARFVIEMQLSLQGRSNKVLSSRMTRRMLTPYLARSNAALGVFIDTKEDSDIAYFQHSGLNEGFTSQYYGSVEGGNGVVVMINSDHSALIREIVSSVAAVYQWKDFYRPEMKKEVKIASKMEDEYIGKYTFGEQSDQTVSIYKKDGKLMFHDSHSPIAWEMHFTDDRSFFFYEVYFNTHTFSQNATGKIDGFYIRGDNIDFKVTKTE